MIYKKKYIIEKRRETDNIFFIAERGKSITVSQSDIDRILNHYEFNVSQVNEHTIYVNVATAQRAGTWLHKYFFKYYADSYSKILLHIGPKLSNPIFCKDLNTLFFVGHYPYPFSPRIFSTNTSSINKNRERVFKKGTNDINQAYLYVVLTEEADILYEKFSGYFQHLFTHINLIYDSQRLDSSTFNKKGIPIIMCIGIRLIISSPCI